MTQSHIPSGRTLRKQQKGFSLTTVIILLVIVTIMGIAASQMVLLSERSTRFGRDQQIAFQAAEAALLDAEFDIRGPNTSSKSRVATFSPSSLLGFIAGCGTGTQLGLCMPANPGEKPIWYTVDFTDRSANARTVEFGAFTGRTLSTGNVGIRPEFPPRYIIEVLPDPMAGHDLAAPKAIYRVTAMGFGPRQETQAVLQMILRKE
ncbi:MAG: hypothetical protein A2W72_03910 [Burkholderiales bacterium RIFCSPLOWO2_12_67_14]|nr:MAG: hypothetical protein A3I64_20040 [Burkholderiales bacterium RIFCSPLOWO2_02_FULL_67_64]OGB42839.1 MAG: hypothetical protein A2W72_03910 [Burkholderiales bacterium RIFCSPLOWO2_12_67_14]OGB49943.1 MAG: hypothetical protein A3E51_15305 [Burkholderiales bacterium RIFCSPHIGHO2_12_FULL_67_38]OGB77472.1 MAG: hypothetical protein A3G82_10085 [Burkholderiales bacterium RIFCSPLOWO2_12_FULL_67_210]